MLVVELCGNNEDYVKKYLTQKGMKKNFVILLTDDINRGEAVYSTDLYVEPAEIYTADEEGVYFSNPCYTAGYSSGVLTVSFSDYVIAFVNEKNAGQVSADMYFIYGNVKNNDNITGDSYIINREGNNFEYKPSDNRIRSL